MFVILEELHLPYEHSYQRFFFIALVEDIQSRDIIIHHFVTSPFKIVHFQIYCKKFHDKVTWLTSNTQ